MIETSRISFLGVRGLAALRSATISVLGAGGGGSHIVQQLAHLAVGRIVAIDYDRLDRSNVNRVVGTSYEHLGEHKAVLLARRFAGLGGKIIPVLSKAEEQCARNWIRESDIVVGALDGFRARDNVERIARAGLVPYIDIGLNIVTDEENAVSAIGGQVVTSVPGGPCLKCLGIITDEALARDREEYAPGAPEQQVISMNGILASQAVTATLALLTGYAPGFPVPVHLMYDGVLHELRPNRYLPAHPCPHYPIEKAGWTTVLPPMRSTG